MMTYASVSRGFRGGGFNPPVAPFRTYTGDNVWTYEIGNKYESRDRRFSLSVAAFYNDYHNYIGLNSIALATTGGFTTVDLNTGDVTSYGVGSGSPDARLDNRRWLVAAARSPHQQRHLYAGDRPNPLVKSADLPARL